jgi:hypothetical protein
MLKNFSEFKKESTNEGNIYGYSRLSDEKELMFQKKLEPFTKKHKQMIFEMDKMYNELISQSISEIIENGYDYYNDLDRKNEKFNRESDAEMEKITNFLNSLDGDFDGEFGEWEDIEYIAEDIRKPAYDKYNSLYYLINKMQEITELKLESFKENSANIIIDNNE